MRLGLVATRTFLMADQLAFARLSGDCNPIHYDETFARRTQAAVPVVHGMHAIIWALEALDGHKFPISGHVTLSAKFKKFIILGAPVALKIIQRTKSGWRAKLSVRGLDVSDIVVRVDATGGEAINLPFEEVRNVERLGPTPKEPDLASLKGLGARLEQIASDTAWNDAFPRATERLGVARLASLAAMSAVVGMIAPGLHSIFTEFSVQLHDPNDGETGLRFRVAEVDERYGAVTLLVVGPGMAGKLQSFMRPRPVASRHMEEIATDVEPNEFFGSHALLIGGSRGIGATTAKLLAAGGSSVTVTYARGRSDAELLVQEVNAYCGDTRCRAISLDVTKAIGPQVAPLATTTSHMYYFATPAIFVQKAETFSHELFRRFEHFYVSRFYATVRALRRCKPDGLLRVLYPSSVAVEDRPAGMTEYAMAKAAGEMLCADLEQADKRLRILTSRLPRVLTDQTATILDVESADAFETMLPLCRKLHED